MPGYLVRARVRQVLLRMPMEWALALLPVRLVSRMVDLATPLYRFVAMRRKTYLERNLRRAFGDRASPAMVRDIARRYYGNAARQGFGDLILAGDPAEPRHGVVRGREHLDAALARGAGVMMLSVHCFADRVGRRYLKNIGYPALTERRSRKTFPVGNAITRHLLRRHTEFLHSIAPNEISSLDPECALTIVRHLREGRIVHIYADAIALGKSIELPFLGATCQFAAGIMDIIRITGCTVVPMFCQGDIWRPEITFHPAVELDRDAPRERFAETNLPRLVGIMEAHILSHPDHWFVWPVYAYDSNE